MRLQLQSFSIDDDSGRTDLLTFSTANALVLVNCIFTPDNPDSMGRTLIKTVTACGTVFCNYVCHFTIMIMKTGFQTDLRPGSQPGDLTAAP